VGRERFQHAVWQKPLLLFRIKMALCFLRHPFTQRRCSVLCATDIYAVCRYRPRWHCSQARHQRTKTEGLTAVNTNASDWWVVQACN